MSMLATTSPVLAPVMTAPPIEYDGHALGAALVGQRQFKKHKALPKPHRSSQYSLDYSYSVNYSPVQQAPKLNLVIDSANSTTSSSQPSSPRTLKHQPKKLGNGPELPPTPPTHSRTSSSSQTALPSSPTLADQPLHTPKSSMSNAPVTPPEQRSPPTPDVTPPQPESRPRALRPTMSERIASSRNTTAAGSRTESFTTAREEPLSSEEDDGQSTIRAALTSGRTSQTTVRKISDSKLGRAPNPQALNTALARLSRAPEDLYTPRTRGEFGQFDGEWGSVASPGEVEQEWDDNLNRMVVVKQRAKGALPTKLGALRSEVVEDKLVAPTNATKAVRQMSLDSNRERGGPPSKKASVPTKSFSTSREVRASGPSKSDPSVVRSRTVPSKQVPRQGATTIIEAAIFIDHQPKPPQRERTLRHVRKQSALREPSTPPLSVATRDLPIYAQSRNTSGRNTDPQTRFEPSRHDSYASTMTASSVASGKARRDVWKSGGIPVVVVPDRRSSKSSREPSLRSTSSRRSKRTMSLGSSPVEGPTPGSVGPVFERPTRRSRAYSLSDRSERSERTIDFPPTIPVRSSSLSAPTSRNTSRAGSMTADSIRARDQAAQAAQAAQAVSSQQVHDDHDKELLSPMFPPTQAEGTKSDRDEGFERWDQHDSHGDALSVKRYTDLNTPFSFASAETNGTAHEVSEALAVHMYPHQNSSVLMVNHSSKPSDASEVTKRGGSARDSEEAQTFLHIGDDDNIPVTPPQPPKPQFSIDDIESPLRNPRAPPAPPIQAPDPISDHPPALNLIPATPSGATPAHDKAVQMGNYFETLAEDPTMSRRPSLIRRALGRRRRHSMEYPPNSIRAHHVILRSLSFTRKRPSNLAADNDGLPGYRQSGYPQEGEDPPEEHKLHPFWRPQWPHNGLNGWDDRDDDDEDEYYKYPLVDNRPRRLKRSFSDKMKRTFAVLPIRDDDDDYYVDHAQGPERRTIRRTSSGNLRVMRRRSSAESLPKRRSWGLRPATAPEEMSRRVFPRSLSRPRGEGPEKLEMRRRFSLSGQVDGLQNIPRKFSEKRREKRTQELRQKISGPRQVRDGVEEMLRSGASRENRGAPGRI